MINTEMENNVGAATMIENSADTSTAQNEAIEQLSAKMHVTLDEAKVVLNAANWNMLTATHLLEQEEFRQKQELNTIMSSQENATSAPEQEQHTVVDRDTVADSQAVSDNPTIAEKSTSKEGKDTMKKFGQTIMDLLKRGNRNHFVIHRNGEQILDFPVTILVLLLLGSFGTCAFLMVLGLFFGCRYTISENNIATAEA